MVYIFALFAILTASFKNFFIINILIIIHELGHYTIARILGIKVDKIYLYPLGGVSKLNMPLNTSSKKEFIILIAGPIFQVVASLILVIIMPLDKKLILSYHYGILFFNLLPIYPLDGGKIVNLFLSKFIPYRLCLKISIYISYLSLLIIIFLKKSFTLNIIIMTILSLILITKEKSKINYIYNKFMLERYLNNYNFKKSCIIKNSNNFYRNKRHLINDRGIYYLENEYLSKKYQKFGEKR